MNEMSIASAKYTDSEKHTIVAVIQDETMYVPLNPSNRHYAEIMRQVDAGELTIADAD